MVFEVRRLSTSLRPDLVHAHNYEALVACLAARPTAPLVYHAHTLFGLELPTFAGDPVTSLLARTAGCLADRIFPSRASRTLAVSPRLVRELIARGHPEQTIECSLPGHGGPVITRDGEARRRDLGLEGDEVLGYCGNLDHYQGLDTLLDVLSILAQRRRRVKALVVTASDPAHLLARARGRGLEERLKIAAHGDISDVLELLTATQVCLAPRVTPGGFPIKLLTYLAAGRPVVTTRAGAAGLDLGEAVTVVADADPGAMAGAVEWLLDHPEEAEARGMAGQELLSRELSWNVAGERLEAQLRRALVRGAD
jgi:glycosyltransferase involved in cell wall biosynthesis